MRDGRALALLVCAALLVATSAARADLPGDVETLVQGFRRAGAAVRPVATLFLIRDEARAVDLAAATRSKHRCVAVVALAHRQVSFRLEVGGATGGTHARDSEAGVARLDDCGHGALRRGALRVVMSSPRAAVEVIAVSYDARVPDVVALLPARAIGPASPRGELGSDLQLAPLKDRAARVERIARADGARTVVAVNTRSGNQGGGAMVLKLTAGCHRLSVLPEGNAGSAGVDVDAEIKLRGAATVLRRDRSHAPDARLDFCLGETAETELRFAGAGGPQAVTVLDAHWPMPEGIPTHWGRQAHAAFAWALLRRQAPPLQQAPEREVLLPSGYTLLGMDVEPGACYLAAVALTRGEAGGGRLSVALGRSVRYDDVGDGAAVSFCVPPNGPRRALVELDMAAPGSWWVLAMWRWSPVKSAP